MGVVQQVTKGFEMRDFIIRAAMLLGLYGMCAAADAEISVETYKEGLEKANTRQILENYIAGVGRGIWIANYDCHNCHFCPPEEFIAQGANFSQWLNEAIRNAQWVSPSHPIEVVLMFKVKAVFPCLKR